MKVKMGEQYYEKQKTLDKGFFLYYTGHSTFAIGGEAMTLPVSLLVFDETQSAFLSSPVMICGILPDVLLPIFIAPFTDKAGKKKWILGMNLMLAVVYAGQSQRLLQCTVRRGRGSLPVSGRRTWAAHTLSRCGGSAWRHGCRKRLPVHCSSCRRQPAGI